MLSLSFASAEPMPGHPLYFHHRQAGSEDISTPSSSTAGAEGGAQDGCQSESDPQGQAEEADPVTEMLVAWEHGLSNDGMQEWGHRWAFF